MDRDPIISPGFLIPIKLAVYIAAFWIFGARIVRRDPLPSFGWSALGGLARFLAGALLGGGLGVGLYHLHAPFQLVIVVFAVFRFLLWWGMAAFLFRPSTRKAMAFAGMMTVVNFRLDVAFFGWPTARDMECAW